MLDVKKKSNFLEAFSLKECEEYENAIGLAFTRMQILQYYMIFGGVPFYWSFLKKGFSMTQNIDNILFAKDAPLKKEFEYLYASIFQLIDNFTLFYYKFLQNYPTDEHYWANQVNTPSLNNWLGLAFERICLEHINQIKVKLGISGVHTEVNSWYCKADSEKGIFGSQIDLLIARADQVINMCEMKYSGTNYAIKQEEDENIRKRISDLINVTKNRCAVFPTLITTYGLSDNAYASNIQSVVTLDDLFV